MKVAIVTRYPPLPEGISDYGKHVAGALAQRAEVERVTVVANRIDQPTPRPDGAIEVRRVWRENDPWTPIQILGAIRASRADAAWFNVSLAMFGTSPAVLGSFLLPGLIRRLGLRSIVTLHELPSTDLSQVGFRDGRVRRLGLSLALNLLRQADTVCVTIDGFRQRLGSGRDDDRMVYLPLSGYADPELAPFVGPPTILILTSHAPHKNLQLLVEAFRLVRAAIPTARLLVAGIDHPRYPGYLAEVKRSYPAEPGVSWLGALSDKAVAAELCSAWIVVAPYRVVTGSSATIHRAIAAGRPVVATDLPEFRAMAAEEDLWLEYFPRDDGPALGAALTSLLADPERRAAMAERNYRSAQRNSLSATADAYIRLFRGTAPRSLSVAAPARTEAASQ